MCMAGQAISATFGQPAVKTMFCSKSHEKKNYNLISNHALAFAVFPRPQTKSPMKTP